MSSPEQPSSVAVIGAGLAGSACAVALQRAGLKVTLLDKSRGVGGRMALRRLAWRDAQGLEHSVEVDHGAQHFGARDARFAELVKRAVAAGVLRPWQPRVHAGWPAPSAVRSFVPQPGMPALCRHLLGALPVRVEHAVQELRRERRGWRLVLADGRVLGPFDRVVLAMPAAQAAALLAAHQPAWADALADVRMHPCWTLMAVTDDVDWPWDAAEPDHGPLAWIARNDRKPGRSAPPGIATWVAHATPEWSAPRLELQDTQPVVDALQRALGAAVCAGGSMRWHHASVHRWRHAVAAQERPDGGAWWDAELGLGVCGDFLGAGDVEAAWLSGDALADAIASADEPVQRDPRRALAA
jgi:renalase